jgi:HD superfamily phosphohydrolase
MKKLIFDPVHNYIEVDRELLAIIDTTEFQRLRYIKQLGVAYHVFIGASHNRFEHSIGVAYLCGLLMKNLKERQPELYITDRDIILVKIAGLCHDLGHACFSHFFDDYFLKTKLAGSGPEKEQWIHHEYRSEVILKHIISKYKLPYTEDEIDFICELINSKKRPKKLQKGRLYRPEYLYEIVSNGKSGLDCDKIDYLLRDTKNIGLNSSFEYNRLFSQARVIQDTICYPDKEVFNIYELFHSRYKMHKQFYQHPVINQLDFMILDILNEVDDEFSISKNITDIDHFISYTDNLLDRIRYTTTNTNAKKILEQIDRRELYEFVGEIIFDGKNEEIKQQIETYKQIITKYELDSNVIITKFNINFNLKNKNPVDEIYFYKISEPHTKYKIKKKMVSLILPSIFEETIYRIIIRDNKIIKNDEGEEILCKELFKFIG